MNKNDKYLIQHLQSIKNKIANEDDFKLLYNEMLAEDAATE
jgi:hypothetical protein